MTFNELVAWIVSKPHGRILVERSQSKRSVEFYLSCQSLKGDPPQILGVEVRVDLRDLQFLGGKEQAEKFIGEKFDQIKRDFEVLENS